MSNAIRISSQEHEAYRKDGYYRAQTGNIFIKGNCYPVYTYCKNQNMPCIERTCKITISSLACMVSCGITCCLFPNFCQECFCIPCTCYNEFEAYVLDEEKNVSN